VPGEVDRESRPTEQERDRVPGVRVQPCAMQQRHLGSAVSETQRAQGAAIRQGERDTLDGRHVGAEGLCLAGQVAELAGVFNHGHILLSEQAAREMREQNAYFSTVISTYLLSAWLS
jgi:hypothetical protein